MTQEEKEILFKDICCRQPYGVMVNFTLGDISFDERVSSVFSDGCGVQVCAKNGFLTCPLEGDRDIELSQVKPYLRPMESMTDEENLRLDDLEFDMAHLKFTTYFHECAIMDYLYSRHIDVRGLIPMGLALEAPKGMY